MSETPAGNRQRALWTFVVYALAAPLAGAALGAAAATWPISYFRLLYGSSSSPLHDTFYEVPLLGTAIVWGYLGSIVPLALTAIMLMPSMLTRGGFGARSAATAGAAGYLIMVFVAAPISGIQEAAMSYGAGILRWIVFHAAFFALVSLAAWAALARGGVVKRK